MNRRHHPGHGTRLRDAIYPTWADWEPGYLVARVDNPAWQRDPGAWRVRTVAVAAARAFLAAGVPVAAICGATAGLARAGLLDDRAHTSSAPEYLLHAGDAYQGAALYRDEPAVTDRGLITAGATHPVEFAREALEQLDVFPPEVLDGWFRLFGRQDATGFAALAGAPA